jgi:hypothetical protein
MHSRRNMDTEPIVMASHVIVEKPHIILDRTQSTERTPSLAATLNLRPAWRGFSFSGFWFSYYYFTGGTPSCAGGKLIPG